MQYLREEEQGESDNGGSPEIPSPECPTQLSLCMPQFPYLCNDNEAWLRFDQGPCTRGASYCKVSAMGSISPTQEAETREGRGQVCVCVRSHMYIQRSASGTGPLIFCTQALGVP